MPVIALQIAFIAAPDATAAYSSENAAQILAREQPYRRQHLYIMDADGSHKRCLTQDARYFDQEPSWSADGRTLSFIRYDVSPESQSRSLWAIRPDGTGLTHVRSLPPKNWTCYAPHLFD